MKYDKTDLFFLIITITIIILLWLNITLGIQRIKNSEMTETELFLHIPKSFVCDWE